MATPRAPRSRRRRYSPRSRGTASCTAPTRCIPAGRSPRTSATRRPSTATRSSASASRPCPGCRSRAWPTSSSRCSGSARISERPLEVVEPDEPPARIDDDADRVETQVGRPRGALHIGEERRRDPPHLRALALVERLPRPASRAALAPRLDLDEHECGAVVDAEVDLAPPRAVVARDELVAETLEVGEREVLAGSAEVLTGVCGHGRPR